MHNDMHYLNALGRIALQHGFRMPGVDETWSEYVNALADHVEPNDPRAAADIRYGMAWMMDAA